MIPDVLFIMEDVASFQYFFYYPLLMLHRQGKIRLEVNLESIINSYKHFNLGHLTIFSRSHSQKTTENISSIKRAGIPHVFENDDDLFQYRIDYSEQKDITQTSLDRLTYEINNASLVLTFPQKMSERVRTLTTYTHENNL